MKISLVVIKFRRAIHFVCGHLWNELPVSGEEVQRHVSYLAHISDAPDHHKDLFDHLYSCLSILDAKASALLSFDSIVLAVYSIFLVQGETRYPFILAVLGMATILCSAMLLLWVVWVHWSTTHQLQDYEEHARTLLYVRRVRTIRYRLAWDFSVVSLLILCLLVLEKLIERTFA